MKIIWSPLAVDRVSEIAEYIALDKPPAAEKWVDAIFNSVKRLEQFPESGRIIPEIQLGNFREIIFGNYRIIYGLPFLFPSARYTLSRLCTRASLLSRCPNSLDHIRVTSSPVG